MDLLIPLQPITKKNHGAIIHVGKRHVLLPSKQYIQYEKECLKILPKRINPIECQVNLKCLFYMGTHRIVDLTGLLQSIQDILVKAEILADDNSRIIVTTDGSRVLYDKENPRTEITITRVGDKICCLKTNKMKSRNCLKTAKKFI